MDAKKENENTSTQNDTTVERISNRDLVITRTINGSARMVFEAFTKAELLKQWWVPKSTGMTLRSCETDVRVGGGYRLVYNLDAAEPMAFYGRYLEVIPYSRLVWTNDEGNDGGAVTTVTFEETDGKTRLTMHDRYPLEDSFDETMESCMRESLDQLNDFIVTQGAGLGRS